jgi:hypothetical protein
VHQGGTAIALQAAVLNAKGVNPTGKVRPSVLALSRQGLPNLPGTSKEGVLKGGYTVYGGDDKPAVIFLASGAHLHPCHPLHALCSWSLSPRTHVPNVPPRVADAGRVPLESLEPVLHGAHSRKL